MRRLWQQTFFELRTFDRAHWDIAQELQPTKLKRGPPLECGGDFRVVRYHKPGQ
jgi:hypothetical protein